MNSIVGRCMSGTLMAVCSLCTGTSEASAPLIDLPSTADLIVVDGVLDDAAWQSATQVVLSYETTPGENIEARVKTIAYLIEDGQNLYIAFEASDPDPSAIRAYLRDRDSAYNDDFVGITIDTYNDSRRAFEFFSNPLGVQMDLTNNETGSGNNEDDSWDAIWDSAGKIHEQGYAVEMRIPLNQLRFPSGQDLQQWGIALTRTYPRDRRYQFSNVPVDRDINCYLCQISTMSGLEGAEPGRDLEVVPTITASKSDHTDDPGIEPMISGSAKTEAGISVRWGITPDVTANLAINPDFSQVEADAAQLDVNNRFALFFPESRPFFLEGADYFSTPIQTVFTRTIASPNVGAKITGKRGDNTFGVLAVQDDTTNLLFPGAFSSDSTTLEQTNNAFVGRYIRSFGDNTQIGGVVTARNGDGYHNYVGGLDARWRVNDRHTLSAQHVQSDTKYPLDTAAEFEQPRDAFDGTSTMARYEYGSRNWFGGLSQQRSTEGFRSDAGFESQVGVNRQEIDLGRVWYGEDGSWWHRIRVRSEYKIGHLIDGRFSDREAGIRIGVGGPLQSWTQISFVGGSELEAGQIFKTHRVGLYQQLTPFRGLNFTLYADRGDRVDYSNARLGEQSRIESSLNWNLHRNFLLRFNGVLVSMDTLEGETVFDASVIDARLTWQFNIRSFLRLTVQNSVTKRNPDAYIDDVDARSKDVGRQLLYSYKINPQTVFFLGYSDQYVDDDVLSGLTVSDRSLFMKIGYAWNL